MLSVKIHMTEIGWEGALREHSLPLLVRLASIDSQVRGTFALWHPIITHLVASFPVRSTG